MTYNDYLIKITETMKIRSTNYRLSQNDIIYLANNIYEEIALECAIDFIRQEVLISKDIDTYDLDALYTPPDNSIPMNVISIYDDTGASMDRVIREIGQNVYKFNVFLDEISNTRLLEELDGKNIVFYRSVIPDIETLSDRNQVLIFNAMIEGMLWYAHDNIPNPVSSQAPENDTNYGYQRYHAAKEKIKKLLPQRM